MWIRHLRCAYLLAATPDPSFPGHHDTAPAPSPEPPPTIPSESVAVGSRRTSKVATLASRQRPKAEGPCATPSRRESARGSRLDSNVGQASPEQAAGSRYLPGRETAFRAPMHQPVGKWPQKTSPDDVDARTLRVASAKAVRWRQPKASLKRLQ